MLLRLTPLIGGAAAAEMPESADQERERVEAARGRVRAHGPVPPNPRIVRRCTREGVDRQLQESLQE